MSDRNSWATPIKYLHSVRQVMGNIELDPASHKQANKNVRATAYYTAEDNGLEQHWKAKTLFLNPPYSKDLIGKFMTKVTDHYVAGDINQAIVLTNNCPDTAWFDNTLAVHGSAFCFPSKRIQFIAPKGVRTSSNSRGQVFTYLGNNPQSFIAEFSQYGLTVKPVKCKQQV